MNLETKPLPSFPTSYARRLRALLRVAPTALLAAVVLTGCAQPRGNALTGRKYSEAGARKIVKGKTTKAEVLRLVGEPLTRSNLGNGVERFNYSYFQARHTAAGVVGLVSPAVGVFNEVAGVKERSLVHRFLFVTFGADGIVSDVEQSEFEH